MIWDRDVETAPPADVRALAEAAWESQLAHLREHSDFYSARLGGGQIRLTDLRNLPFTTKQDLKRAIDERPPFGSNLCVPEAQVKRIYQTSGTTGAPSVLALTPADADTWTEIGMRTYTATGIQAEHTVLITFGAGPFVAGHGHFTLGRIGARVVPVGPGDTERVLFALSAGLADTLLATPSFAQYLANRADPPQVAHVVVGGEPGGGIPEVRDHIQARLGAFVNEIMGIGDISPSLFGECRHQQGMHFSGTGHVWPELVDPDSREPMEIETGAVGELAYTHLTRQAMPVLRFLGGDIVRIEGTACECGRTSFRMRCLGRRDDMFIVRGVNVYPSAILAVVGAFKPRVTGRARVVRDGDGVSVEPPVPVEVEVAGGADPGLAGELEQAIRARLTFRASVRLVPEAEFGDAGYKTRLSVRR
ncbi:MAG TPA: phenylacetate--CoA ligase family protein [Candidatus Dormibacteraeota bacterium]